MKERVVSGFNASRTVILTSKTGIAVEERRFSKMQNWRHYLSKFRVKMKKNWHDHWEWLNKLFQNVSKPWEWFRSKEIGCHTNWSREMLNGVCLIVNSFLKGKDGFLHCDWEQKWVHYDNSKRRKSWGVPGHASIVDGQTEYSRLQGHALYLVRPARRSVLLWTVKTDWNNHRRSVSNAIDAFEPSIERQTATIHERHDKVILPHNNARPHVAKVVKTYLETLKWEVLPHPPYSPDVLPLTITCFDQRHTAWLTSTSGLMKK